MAKATEKKALKKGKAQFHLIGKAKVTDKTFNVDNTYDSGWTDNSMYLGVDCGEGNTVFTELRGGYFPDKDNTLRGFSKEDKNENGKSAMVEVDWEDRFNDEILDTIADSSFITVGVEKTDKGKTLYKKFLSAYDAVEYLNEHLEDGVILNIKGNISYSEYDGNVSVKKEITSIVLSKVENEEDFKSTFTQTILIDSDSIGKIDKERNTIGLDAYVVEYVGNPKIDGKKIAVKTNVVFPKNFEIEIREDKEITNKMLAKFFKISKKDSLTEITVDGKLIEGQAVVNITEDDIPDDIKELIEMGLYGEDEAKAKCAVGNNNREKRYVIVKPTITYVGTDENRKPTVAFETDKYKASDLVFYEQALEAAGADLSDKSEDTEIATDPTSNDEDDLLAMLDI